MASCLVSGVPVRGVPGGWRDPWDVPDDHAELRTQAETDKCRLTARIQVVGRRWRGAIGAERWRCDCARQLRM